MTDQSIKAIVASLRYDGNDIVITPIRRGWRIEYQERVVETLYLEHGIAEAVSVDAKQAVSLATSLLDEYFASLSSTDGSS